MPYEYEPELEQIKEYSGFFTHGYLSFQVGTVSLHLDENGVEVEEHDLSIRHIIKIGANKGRGLAIQHANQSCFTYWSELTYQTFRPEIQETWGTLLINERYPTLPFEDFDAYAQEFYNNFRQGISVNRAREPEWLLYQHPEMQNRYPPEELEAARRRQRRGRR